KKLATILPKKSISESFSAPSSRSFLEVGGVFSVLANTSQPPQGGTCSNFYFDKSFYIELMLSQIIHPQNPSGHGQGPSSPKCQPTEAGPTLDFSGFA